MIFRLQDLCQLKNQCNQTLQFPRELGVTHTAQGAAFSSQQSENPNEISKILVQHNLSITNYV